MPPIPRGLQVPVASGSYIPLSLPLFSLHPVSFHVLFRNSEGLHTAAALQASSPYNLAPKEIEVLVLIMLALIGGKP